MEPRRKRLIAVIVLAHFALIACYTFPRAWVPDRFYYWSVTYARPLFHQGWELFAPDPPRCSCGIEVGLNDQDWRPLDLSQGHYLATRMTRNIAAYQNGGSPFPDTLHVDPLMEQAMRGMVRDVGREVKDLRFRAVQQCVVDDRRPLDRSIRFVPIVFAEPHEP